MDIQERNAIVLQYQKLVYKIACRLYKYHPLAQRAGSLDALVSSGNVALLDAIRLYRLDHPGQAKFITFAYRCIRQRMLRDAASESVIAIPEKVRLALAGYRGSRCYLAEGDRACHASRLPPFFDITCGAGVVEKLDERMELVERALRQLSGSDRQLLESRFGLAGQPPQLLRVLAGHYGITRKAVRQRLLTVLGRLRRLVKETV